MKKITIVILLVSMLLLLCGCSRYSSSINNSFTTKETTTKAYIKIGGRTIAVDVKDYTISSIGTVEIYETDGKIYRTHWANVVLIKDTKGQ